MSEVAGAGDNGHETVHGVKRSTTPKPEQSVLSRIFGFIEQPLTLGALFLLAGVVGAIIFTPAFAVCAICVLLGFHRSGVVSGYSIKVQVTSYIVLSILLAVSGYFLYQRLNSALERIQDDFAKRVASFREQKPPTNSPKSGTKISAPSKARDIGPHLNAGMSDLRWICIGQDSAFEYKGGSCGNLLRSLVLPIINERGGNAKVKAQLVFSNPEVQKLELSPAIWLNEKTSSVDLDSGETKLLVIATARADQRGSLIAPWNGIARESGQISVRPLAVHEEQLEVRLLSIKGEIIEKVVFTTNHFKSTDGEWLFLMTQCH